jgi:hypothetical protein
MTATNHALTGAVIAMWVKRPELAIPLAFLSHFVLDAIPHYNPPNMVRSKFENYSENYNKKLQDRNFRIILPLDMLLYFITLIILPFLAPSGVSPLTVFICEIVAVAPDFDGGIRYLLQKFTYKTKRAKDDYWFKRFHLWFQWMERPWGIYVELVYLAGIVYVISNLVS